MAAVIDAELQGEAAEWLATAVEKGFRQVCIIERASFATLATTSETDIATAWNEGDVFVNENQELLDFGQDDDGTGKKKDRKNFYFFAKRFNIVQRPPDLTAIVAMFGTDTCLLALQTPKIWFLVTGKCGGTFKKKGDAEADTGKKFPNAPNAYNAIFDTWKEIADDHEE